MNKRSSYVLAAVVLGATLVTTGILASNMGYKLNKPLYGPGLPVSYQGINTLALPYFLQPGLSTSLALMQDIEGGGPPFSKVGSVWRYLEQSGSFQVYTGRMGSPSPSFSLNAGECLFVQMQVDYNYRVVGSQDPALALTLDAPGPSNASGQNWIALPYNVVPLTGFDLMKDIEKVSAPPFSKVTAVAKFLTASSSLQVYTGRMGSPARDFNILPGECHLVQMSVTVPYIPSHY